MSSVGVIAAWLARIAAFEAGGYDGQASYNRFIAWAIVPGCVVGFDRGSFWGKDAVGRSGYPGFWVAVRGAVGAVV